MMAAKSAARLPTNKCCCRRSWATCCRRHVDAETFFVGTPRVSNHLSHHHPAAGKTNTCSPSAQTWPSHSAECLIGRRHLAELAFGAGDNQVRGKTKTTPAKIA
jgi:hypothetical protein